MGATIIRAKASVKGALHRVSDEFSIDAAIHDVNRGGDLVFQSPRPAVIEAGLADGERRQHTAQDDQQRSEGALRGPALPVDYGGRQHGHLRLEQAEDEGHMTNAHTPISLATVAGSMGDPSMVLVRHGQPAVLRVAGLFGFLEWVYFTKLDLSRDPLAVKRLFPFPLHFLAVQARDRSLDAAPAR